MVVRTILGQAEENELERLLYAEEKTEALTKKTKRQYEARYELIGATVFSVLDFKKDEDGMEQFLLLRQGSVYARDKGLGQTVLNLATEEQEFYDPEYLTVVMDADSYTPEKLIGLGYIAKNLVSEGCVVEFIEPETQRSSVMPLQSKHERSLSFGNGVSYLAS